jgi:CHRD domain
MRIRVFLAAALVALVGTLALATAAGATGTHAAFVTVMTGAAEAPGPGDPDGIGVAGIAIDTGSDTVCWALFVRRITLPATAAHIHVAPAGTPGPIVVNLTPPNAFGFSFGCTTDSDADAIAANPSNYYVNVHTTDFPAGAVRGQLG